VSCALASPGGVPSLLRANPPSSCARNATLGDRRRRFRRPRTLAPHASAPAIEERLFERGETLHAPHLVDLEVLQVLRRYAAAGEISAERAREALDDLAAFRLRRWAHDALALRIWELRQSLAAYDAAYVALAEALSAPLLTRDRRLALAPGIRAHVEVA
jgi:predicted nucleic acid-binding protein